MIGIYILWTTSTILILFNVLPYIKENINILEKMVFVAVVLIGAPVMLVANALQLILDLFLNEGWDDND